MNVDAAVNTDRNHVHSILDELNQIIRKHSRFIEV